MSEARARGLIVALVAILAAGAIGGTWWWRGHRSADLLPLPSTVMIPALVITGDRTPESTVAPGRPAVAIDHTRPAATDTRRIEPPAIERVESRPIVHPPQPVVIQPAVEATKAVETPVPPPPVAAADPEPAVTRTVEAPSSPVPMRAAWERTFAFRVFRETRVLTIAPNQLTYLAKDQSGRPVGGFSTACAGVAQWSAGRFNGVLHIRLQDGRAVDLNTSGQQLADLLDSYNQACRDGRDVAHKHP